MRALDSNRFQATALFAASTALLLAVWMAWFCFAQITLYQHSETATLQNAGYVLATFSPTMLEHLAVGQTALFQLDGLGERQTASIPVVLISIKDIKAGLLETRFKIQPGTHSIIPLQRGLSGKIEIEAGRLSPLALVLRSMGLSALPSPTAEQPRK